jgi:hypothetical protein
VAGTCAVTAGVSQAAAAVRRAGPGRRNDIAELEADDGRRSATFDTGATADAFGALIRLGQAAEAIDPKLDAIAHEVRAIRKAHRQPTS